MLTSVLQEVRFWSVLWRRRIALYGITGGNDGLVFGAGLALVGVLLVSIVSFAYLHRMRTDPISIEAAHRDRAEKRRLDLRCLAENIYFEARGESLDGQRAVAEVTLNRQRSPNFPHTVCEVVYDTRWDPLRRRLVGHFSWTELDKLPTPSGDAWEQAKAVATAAYDDTYQPVVPGALFYHATSIRPAWAKTKRVVATIGNHIFYR
jgi:spore germination cell wall hydrolase CwlJ-like protein